VKVSQAPQALWALVRLPRLQVLQTERRTVQFRGGKAKRRATVIGFISSDAEALTMPPSAE